MRKTLIALSTVLLSLFLLTMNAWANYYAIGTFQNGNSYGGGSVSIQIESLYAPDCSYGGHTNQTIWVGTDNTTGYYWAEIGYTYGYHGSCSETYYWARNNPQYGYQDYSLRYLNSIGSTHYFEAQEVYVGEYDVYLDWNKVGADVGANPWTKGVQTGLEYTDPGSSLSATHFDWHQVRSTGCCYWYYWSSGGAYNSYNHSWIWTTHWAHGYDQN